MFSLNLVLFLSFQNFKGIEGKGFLQTNSPFLFFIGFPLSLKISTSKPNPLFCISPKITGWYKLPNTKQETISVPPDIEDKWTFFFTFLYIYSNPSFDNGDPVEQIVLNFFNLYLYFNVGLDFRRASIYFALTPNK